MEPVILPEGNANKEEAAPVESDATSTETATESEPSVSKADGGNNGESTEDIISYQTNEKDNSFFKALASGFVSLKEAKETKRSPLFQTDSNDEIKSPSSVDSSESAASSHQDEYQRQQRLTSSQVTVNFIDPTTRPAAMTPTKTNNMMSHNISKNTPAIENVYDKLTYIFNRDYESTLRGVQYKNMRSGESDVISSIPVHTVLARTGGSSGNGEAAANVAWGGMAGTTAAPVSDPSEWHNGPFCHVYIAACENIDHYRTRVRPSLQAFVSQIQASTLPTASSATTNSLLGAANSSKPSSNGNSAHILIVYVPTGSSGATGSASNNGGKNNEDSTASTGPVRRALASQFFKARERVANYRSGDNLDNSQHSKDSLGSGGGDGEALDEDAEAMGGVGLHLLKQHEQELLKKIRKDFSTAKVCVLTNSSLEKTDVDAIADQSGMAVRTQQWNAFNRMLGSVIVNGFNDKCRRYNDELRRLDAQRAMAAQAAKKPDTPQTPTNKKPTPISEFNLSYFFLVKESLAFTYEQMQLPSEALLQYDEFRAFLPDLSYKEYKRALRHRRKSKALQDGSHSGPSLFELADAGDFIIFRRRIRSEVDLMPILDIMRRYLFAREIRLLFKMEQPVEVVSRCESFCKLMYSVMMRGIEDIPVEDRHARKVDASKWVVQFVWDVKSACETYLPSLAEVGRDSFGDVSVDTSLSGLASDTSRNAQSEPKLASRLGELLEMARLLLKELGDTQLADENPLRLYDSCLPADMDSAWGVWAYKDGTPGENQENTSFKPRTPRRSRGEKALERQFLLENAFDSSNAFETVYLDLADAIVYLLRYGNRRRLANRLQGEIAEDRVRKGDLVGAAAMLKSSVKVYRLDQWDRCHFWRLFRLAYCQRSTATPTNYLKTLATCFGPRASYHAPKKALLALQDDLERVIQHDSIGEAKYGTIAFLETSLEVPESSATESTLGSGVDRKRLRRRFCALGEKIQVNVEVVNFLPRAIELDSMKLFLVDFGTFSGVVENGESIEEEDAAKIIGIDKKVSLEPGRNAFTFDWEPSTSGQYILSTLEVVWKKGYFYYDSMELPASLLGVDVLPSEPTHSISIDPGYLVPGHDQEVRLTVDAGSDHITGGRVEFSCSEGIAMIGPGKDIANEEWQKDCQVELKALKPGETTSIVVHVRSGHNEAFSSDSIHQVASFDQSHGLTTKVFSTYLHSIAEGSDVDGTPKMKNVLESFAPILEKTALSVDSVDAIWTAEGERALLSINLVSNTPDHFRLEGWSVHLPPPLQIATGVDFNLGLQKASIADGDQIAMLFECTVVTGSDGGTKEDCILHVKLKDDAGKVFNIDLTLDLKEFYLKLLQSKLPKSTNKVKASLKLNSTDGEIGEPVKLSYTIETQAEGDIVYSISALDCDWLISGKTNGSMQRSGFMSLGFMGSCDIVGIPAAPGVLCSFPKIEVGIVSLQGGYTPLKVDFAQPASFQSRSRTSETGVAYVSTKS